MKKMAVLPSGPTVDPDSPEAIALDNAKKIAKWEHYCTEPGRLELKKHFDQQLRERVHNLKLPVEGDLEKKVVQEWPNYEALGMGELTEDQYVELNKLEPFPMLSYNLIQAGRASRFYGIDPLSREVANSLIGAFADLLATFQQEKYKAELKKVKKK
jgi:hypothetical protein